MLDYKLLGTMISGKRKERGLTQKELADVIGVSTNYISEIERGLRYKVSFEIINSIALALECELSEFTHNVSTDLTDLEEYEYENNAHDYINYVRYYKIQDPTRIISTFLQLFLIFPLIDYKDMMECCLRVSGQVFDFEEYIAKQASWAFSAVPDCDAKRYVSRMLEIMKDPPHINDPYETPISALWHTFDGLYYDPVFHMYYNAYIDLIKTRMQYADALKEMAGAVKVLPEYNDSKFDAYIDARVRQRKKQGGRLVGY